MKILFIVPSTHPEQGGVERVSYLLARELKKHSIACYALTIKDEGKDIPDVDGVYEESLPYRPHGGTIASFCEEKDIDIVINQLSFIAPIAKELAKLRNVKIISCFHGSPTFYGDSIRSALSSRHMSIMKLKAIGKRLLLPIYEPYGHSFRLSYDISAYFVLLSAPFIKPFAKTYGIKSRVKFRAINNPLSLDIFNETNEKKEKVVLIVSRLFDKEKRVSLLLRMWADIEKENVAEQWKLIIVGDGRDASRLKQLSKELKLKNCEFAGQQKEVIGYYEKASIFLMASLHEGWGMTLTEAMQMGCVPIAFDTYLSLHEIIDSQECGYIIPEGDVSMYKKAVLRLMGDNDLRTAMAKKAVESSKRFTMEVTCKKWLDLIYSL